MSPVGIPVIIAVVFLEEVLGGKTHHDYLVEDVFRERRKCARRRHGGGQGTNLTRDQTRSTRDVTSRESILKHRQYLSSHSFPPDYHHLAVLRIHWTSKPL